VLYWIGCGVAVITIGLGVLAVLNRGLGAWDFAFIMVIVAIGFWLAGRAVRYVLAGR